MYFGLIIIVYYVLTLTKRDVNNFLFDKFFFVQCEALMKMSQFISKPKRILR